MGLTLITGVPGTGKTAFLVSELEKIAAAGRTIFVDNISGLKIPHYRAGRVSQWQLGTWLHIDQYIRTSPSIVAATKEDIEDDDSDGNQNWAPNPEILKDDDGNLSRVAFDASGKAVGSVPYENHKGALLVIDECQRHFRPRPAGSAVPDFVAALEVHRHQGLDIWLVTQRPGLVDSNVRAICDKHIALRKTPFGRYKYEWPEVGDIESKGSRDTAAKSRFSLPKHVFGLYKSAEVHNKTNHSLPMVAKVLIFVLPVFMFLIWTSYKIVSAKFKGEVPAVSKPADTNLSQASFNKQKPDTAAKSSIAIPAEAPAVLPSDLHHPFEGGTFSIAARVQSSTRDHYRFMLTSSDRSSTYISDKELISAGYKLSDRSDCAVRLTYGNYSTFATCAASNAVAVAPAAPAAASPTSNAAPLPSEPAPSYSSLSRTYENTVIANRSSGA